ncbi:MAG: tetratricopeptide repeat protein [Janthinobacterium lividum]
MRRLAQFLTISAFALAAWVPVHTQQRSTPAVTPEAAQPQTSAAPEKPLPPPSEALADTLSARGRYLLAIRTYEALPTSPIIDNKLGVACLHMLMFERARTNFEAAIKLDPRYAEAWNNLGTLAHSLGDLPRAEKMYKKALKLKPDSPSTLKNLGTLYYAEHKFRKGDRAYHQAIRLDPEALERTSGHDIQTSAKAQSAGEVHYHMALTYAQARSFPLALQYLRKAIGEGFHDRNRLLHEKDFGDLRTQPVFLQMVDDLKKD